MKTQGRNITIRSRRELRDEKLGLSIIAVFALAGLIKFLGHEVSSMRVKVNVTPVQEKSVSMPAELDIAANAKVEKQTW